MRIHLSLLVLLANLLLSRTSDGRVSASSVEAVTPVGTGGPAVDANSVEEATAEGTGGSVIIATSVEEANEDPIHPIELIQIGARSTPPVAPFAAQSVVLSRSQLKLEALAAMRRRRQVAAFSPSSVANKPIWKLSFANSPLTPMSSFQVQEFRQFDGAQVVSEPIEMDAMLPLGNQSGFALTFSFRISVANPCGRDPTSTAEQLLLVGSEHPTLTNSLQVWLQLGTCVLCIGPAAVSEPLCSPSGLQKGILHKVSAVYTAGVSALLWLEGAAVTTLPNTRWTVLATNRLYAGGQPQSSGLVSGGFVGDLGDVALYGQAMTPDEMQHASAVCGDGLVMQPFEQCDDGNDLAGDGCSLAFQYTAEECDSINQEHSSKSTVPDPVRCRQLCDFAGLECSGYAFTPGDALGGFCYLFGVAAADAETDALADYEDLGPGCCSVGAQVIQTQELTSPDADKWFSECLGLCEQQSQCGYINFGWRNAESHIAPTCVLLAHTASAECDTPVATELTCAGVDKVGDSGVHTYKWVRIESSCYTRTNRPGSCSIEHGWGCSGGDVAGPADTCVPECGDSILVDTEQCDDGNVASSDGCTSGCWIEDGWQCEGPGSCSTVCGDGIVKGPETCDDGNQLSGDGCSSQCNIESGWTCDLGGPDHYSSCITEPEPPAAPYSTRVGSSGMLLSWGEPEHTGSIEVSHYKVLINNLEHATVDAHSWDLLQHLPSSSKFQMRVAACSAAGCSAWSEQSEQQRTKALPPVYRIEGGGWHLVRRVAPPLELSASRPSQWHRTDDGLEGSQSYGLVSENPLSTTSFSAQFDQTPFGEYLVATGDASQWAVFDKGMVKDGSPCQVVDIQSFLGGAAVHCAVRDDRGMVELSVSDSQRQFILYRENSQDDTSNTKLGTFNGGNVFIRAGAGQSYACRSTQDGDCKQFEINKGFAGVIPAQQTFQLTATELGGGGSTPVATAESAVTPIAAVAKLSD